MDKRLRIDLKQGCKSKIKVNQAQAAKIRRAQNRATVMASFRNLIQEPPDSPASPPVAEKPTCAAIPQVLDRRQQLERWKREKEERERKEKANEKPIFKLRTVISHTSYPSKVEVPTSKPTKYSGMATRSRTATAPATKAPPTVPKKPPAKPKAVLADIRADKKFVAPKSVLPIPLLTIPRSPFGMSRRKNQGMRANTLANMPQQLLKSKFVYAKGRAVFNAIASAPSPARNFSFELIPKEPACAASPNITVARGNYQQRKRSLSKSITDTTAPLLALTNVTSPLLAAAAPMGKENTIVTISTENNKNEDPADKEKNAIFYRTQLDSEIQRLKKLCEEWSGTKNDPAAQSEEIQGVLDSAIGHTQLLIRSKFEQFRGLTVQCETGTSTPPILVTDLEGFWDMLTIQIENLDKEFKNLEVQKKNGWEKEQPAKEQIKKNTISKKPHTIPVVAAKPSGLKALMLAARKKQMADKALEDKFNSSVNFSNSCLPDPRLQEIKGTPERSTRRISLLQGVLANNLARKAERNSPIVMRVSLNAKAVGLLPGSNPTTQPSIVQHETVAAPTVEEALFVKPSVANSSLGAIRIARKSMSEGKPRKPRERKRLTMLQQLQMDHKMFDTKESVVSVECGKENENFVNSSKFFSPRRSCRLTPYTRRSLSVDARPSLMPLDNWPSPLPLPSGELISFDTPPAVRRSTRSRNP